MRVILFLLKCLVGLFATLGFLALAALAVGTVFWRDLDDWGRITGEVPSRTVLTLDLSAGVIETQPDNPLARVSLRETLVLREAVAALEAAGHDPRVKGLFAHLGRGDLGLSQIQELRDAVFAFRARGQFAIAFAESFGEAGNGTLHYYLANAFEQIWLQPSGDLDLTGVYLESPLPERRAGPAGDRAAGRPARGIQGRHERPHRFPHVGAAAAKPATADRLLGYPDRPRHRRGARADRGPGVRRDRPATARRGQGPRRALDRPARLLGPSERRGPGPGRRRRRVPRARRLPAAARQGTRIGPDGRPGLRPRAGGPGAGENDPVFGSVVMGADSVAAALADAVEASRVEAIVFRIDSPGGSYVASDAIWREVQLARDAGKPVIVSMGNVAASGGYFVAVPAHKIVAQPGTITGSIGVVAGKLVLTGLWDKLDIAWDGVQGGANANFWSMNQDFSEDAWAGLQGLLDRTYEDFTGKVARGRALAPEQVLQAAKGQVWTGEDALELGLVDQLGGLQRAVALAREAAGIGPSAPIRIEVFPEPGDPFEDLLHQALGGEIKSSGALALLGVLARVARAVVPLAEALERLTGDPRAQSLRAREPRLR